MVLLAAFLHALQEAAGIGGAVHYGHLKGQFADGYLSLTHSIVPAHRVQLQQGLRGALAGEVCVGGAQGGLHHAAGVAEDHAGSRGLAHQGVVGGVLQSGPVDAGGLGPPGQLPGGDDLVGVPHSLDAVVVTGGVHLLPPDLEFLGRTRSQSNVDDLPGIQSHLFGKVGLNRGTLHADGAFGGGEMGQQFRGIDLSKVYPAGTAAGELGKGAVFFRDPADQLAGLLHDSQIGGEVGVQHIVHT